MCSISGWIAEKPLSGAVTTMLASGLLFYGRERGNQSGGLALDGRLYKRAIDPAALVCARKFEKLCKPGAARALIHTRMPTCGGLGDAQAQPFIHGDVTTVHNGYFFNIKDLREQYGIGKPSGVDSELVCSVVAKRGAMGLPGFFADSWGPSAVGVWDGANTYLMRNGNPIVYTTMKISGIPVLIFASTGTILLNALGECWPKFKTPIYTLKDETLYSAKPDGVTIVAKMETPWYGRGGVNELYGIGPKRLIGGVQKKKK